MRIAVTYENGDVFQHFGHTKIFKIYNTEAGNIVSSEEVSTNGSGHTALADFLKANKVDALICGGIGGGARIALSQAGISLYPGVEGLADDAVKAYLSNTLNFDPNKTCNHHSNNHEGCSEHDSHCTHLCNSDK